MALLCLCLTLSQWELVEGRGVDWFTSVVIYHLPTVWQALCEVLERRWRVRLISKFLPLKSSHSGGEVRKYSTESTIQCNRCCVQGVHRNTYIVDLKTRLRQGAGVGNIILEEVSSTRRGKEGSAWLGGSCSWIGRWDQNLTPFSEAGRGKRSGKRHQGRWGRKGGQWAVGPMHNYKDPEMERQKQDMQKHQLPPLSPRGGEQEVTWLVTAAMEVTWWTLECAQADSQSLVLPKQSESGIVRPRGKALPFEPEGRKCKGWDQLTVP